MHEYSQRVLKEAGTSRGTSLSLASVLYLKKVCARLASHCGIFPLIAATGAGI